MESFEKKLEKAQKLLDKLNNPEISLYDGMKIYKDGMKALKEANEILEKTKFEYEEMKV